MNRAVLFTPEPFVMGHQNLWIWRHKEEEEENRLLLSLRCSPAVEFNGKTQKKTRDERKPRAHSN